MQLLSRYSPWQIEMVVTASLLELNLVTRSEIVEHVDCLLSKGYYDDAFLPILFDDFLVLEDIKKLFRKVIENNGCQKISTEQARWTYSYVVISNYSAKPENYNVFNNDQISIYNIFYEFLLSGDNAREVIALKDLIYQLDEAYDCADRAGVHQGYNDPIALLTMKTEFFQLCRQWLDKHRPKIAAIFNELYA